MGRDAHVLRLILGRGATRDPDWEALSDQYAKNDGEPTTYTGIDPNNLMTLGKTFDAKGRALDSASVADRDARGNAANNTTSLVQYNTAVEGGRSTTIRPLLRVPRDLILKGYPEYFFEYTGIVAKRLFDLSFKFHRDRLMTFGEAHTSIHGMRMWEEVTPGTSRHLLGAYFSIGLNRSALLEHIFHPPFLGLFDCLSLPFRSDELTETCFRSAEYFSAYVIKSILRFNTIALSMHLLPAPTWRDPLPLLGMLLRLDATQALSTMIRTILPVVSIDVLAKLIPYLAKRVKATFWDRKYEAEDEQNPVKSFSVMDCIKFCWHIAGRFPPHYPMAYSDDMWYLHFPCWPEAFHDSVTHGRRIHPGADSRCGIGVGSRRINFVAYMRNHLMSLPVKILTMRLAAILFLRDPNLSAGLATSRQVMPMVLSVTDIASNLQPVGRMMIRLAWSYLFEAAIRRALFILDNAGNLVFANRRVNRNDEGSPADLSKIGLPPIGVLG